MKLEPVAWMRGGDITTSLHIANIAWPAEARGNVTPLYTIPSGYVLVPVEQAKDAERYRFIRDQHSMGVPNKAYVNIVGADVTWHHPAPKALDILIDQAMTAAGEQ